MDDEYAPFDLIPTDLLIYLATFIAFKDNAKFAKLSRKHANACRYAITMRPGRLIGATVYYCEQGYMAIMIACVQKAGARMMWCDSHLLKCQHDLMISWMVDMHQFSNDALNSKLYNMRHHGMTFYKIIDATQAPNHLAVSIIMMRNDTNLTRSLIIKIPLPSIMIDVLVKMMLLGDLRGSLQALLEDPRIIEYLRLQYLPDWMPTANVSMRCRRMVMDACLH